MRDLSDVKEGDELTLFGPQASTSVRVRSVRERSNPQGETVKTKPQYTLPAPGVAEAFVTEVKPDVEQSATFVERMQITNNAEYEFAGNALKEVALRHDTIEAKRKSWVEPLNAVVKDINETIRPVTKRLKEIEDALKNKLAAFASVNADVRTSLLKEASDNMRMGKTAEATRLLAEADRHVVPELKGVSVDTRWTGEVIDRAAIPFEYLTPDIEKLTKMTEAANGDPGIPGWRAFTEAAVRTSRKGNG